MLKKKLFQKSSQCNKVCYFQVCQPQPSQFCATGTTGAGRHGQPGANRELVEGPRRHWVVWYPSAQRARGERKPQKWSAWVRKATGKAQVYPSLCRDCAIKLLLSSHGVGIPFIASFDYSLSFPVRFIAMIFELLFPVKTFQLLRGRKILCKQSGVRAVNGLHLLIQGNPITCICASVCPGVPVLHLFGITIKWEVPSLALGFKATLAHPPSSALSPCYFASPCRRAPPAWVVNRLVSEPCGARPPPCGALSAS